MSTSPYANTTKVTAKIAIGTVPVLAGTGVAGAALAGRTMWRGVCTDDTVDVEICDSAGDTLGEGFSMQTGVAELRPYGANIPIYVVASAPSFLSVEECS